VKLDQPAVFVRRYFNEKSIRDIDNLLASDAAILTDREEVERAVENIRMIPGGETAYRIARKEYGLAAVTFVGEVALTVGGGQLGKGAGRAAGKAVTRVAGRALGATASKAGKVASTVIGKAIGSGVDGAVTQGLTGFARGTSTGLIDGEMSWGDALARGAKHGVADAAGGFVTGVGVSLLADAGSGVYKGVRNRLSAASNGASRSSAWTRAEVNGTRVYQRDDLINPNLTDKLGRTNLQRMQQGLAPLGPDGKSINLHHMLQTADGPLAEVTQTFQETYSKTIHINPNTIPSGINRPEFDTWRSNYWMKRANVFVPG